MLFVELALIRWLGEQILYLSFFSNFVLLGSFLGIGIGFLRSGRGKSWFPSTPLLMLLLVGFAAAFPVEVDRSGSSLIFFGDLERSGLPTWVMLPVIFVVVAAVLAAIADGVARTFAKFEPLEAYRLDISGSVLGTLGFSVLALLQAPPVVWGLVMAILLALLLDMSPRAVRYLAVTVIVLAVPSFTGGHTWSAYYDIKTDDIGTVDDPLIQILVNGIPHQYIAPVDARLERNAGYFWPYQQLASELPPEEVLIVGAGTGSDVAVALFQNVGHVDAVEIDRALYEIGVERNPDRPYDDPRVDVIIDDGRAYLERTDKKYDMILFALPDSLTLVSGQSSLRLESFLFTEEALATARDRLKPGGVFSMYNFYREQWLIDRLARTLHEAFGVAPCVREVRQEGAVAVLTVSADPTALDCEPSPEVSAAGPEPVTDNYPFLYLREPGIPSFYVMAVLGILLASFVGIRASGGRIRQMTPYADLFFMGVAFLLLETKNIVQFALLFGTTWMVNALVFAGILLTVLAAIEVARRVRLPRPGVLYALLFIALGIAWIVPQSALLDLVLPIRFVVATVLAFTPIFIANIVFAQRFKDTASSTAAFGANLLGAMIGGILEYGSLIVGYRALLIVAAGIYLLAYLAGRKHLVGDAAVPAAVGSSQ